MVLIHPIFLYIQYSELLIVSFFKKTNDCFVLLNLFPYICMLLSRYEAKCPFNTLIYIVVFCQYFKDYLIKTLQP